MKNKTYNITIIYPSKYPIERDITGKLYIQDNHYLIVKDDGKKIFLPMMFTVIEEINE